MILIISSSDDVSTDHVIGWLKHFGADYVRLNFAELMSPDKYALLYDPLNNTLQINQRVLDLNTVKAIWFRKIGSYTRSRYYEMSYGKILPVLQKQQAREFEAFLNAVLKSVPRDAFWLTGLHNQHLSKWHTLRLARDAGLNVPETFLTTEYLSAAAVLGETITKAINEPFAYTYGSSFYTLYTKEVDHQSVTELPTSGFLSVVQKKVLKKLELRIFYINGKCFPMAIFSQKDPTTQLDFRNYNTEAPNRFVPVNIPFEVKAGIQQLMKRLELNCGSVDMIYSGDNAFIFLEVNPFGQFGMVDFPCNYGLHKLIAETLIHHN